MLNANVTRSQWKTTTIIWIINRPPINYLLCQKIFFWTTLASDKWSSHCHWSNLRVRDIFISCKENQSVCKQWTNFNCFKLTKCQVKHWPSTTRDAAQTASPTLLMARQVYSPASSGNTSLIANLQTPSESWYIVTSLASFTGSFLWNQVTLGVGFPVTCG